MEEITKLKRILLFSGGIDSFVAYHYLNYPQTIYFDINSRYSKKEIRVIKQLIPTTIIEKVLDLGDREKDDANIPMRNLYFSMLATKYSDVIYIAGLKDDMVEDKNREIFTKFSELLSCLNNRSIQILSPFWNFTKNQVVDWYLKSGGSKEKLLQTISCYSSDDTIYCGRCTACFRKYVVLRNHGIDIKFYNNDLINIYIDRAKRGVYVPERNKLILKVCNEK